MTATHPDLLADLVEGQTYQLGTSAEHPDGSGCVRWELFLYQNEGWHQIETRVTAKPPNGHYLEPARGWLRTLGLDPDGIDIVMILPDGYERLRP